MGRRMTAKSETSKSNGCLGVRVVLDYDCRDAEVRGSLGRRTSTWRKGPKYVLGLNDHKDLRSTIPNKGAKALPLCFDMNYIECP